MMLNSILLASASPRRAELLRQIGLPFSVCPADIDESIPAGLSPIDAVAMLSRVKAQAVSAKAKKGELILAADTIVVLDSDILGKPQDESDAVQMLMSLSGREHFVHTGLTLLEPFGGKLLTQTVTTKVKMHTLSKEQICTYVATGEPMDKAGAYGIQGRAACFVESIDGCYFNVMGLPLAKLTQMLEKFQVYITKYWE